MLKFSGNLARVSLLPGPEGTAIKVALVDTRAQLACGPIAQPCKSQVMAATDQFAHFPARAPHVLISVC